MVEPKQQLPLQSQINYSEFASLYDGKDVSDMGGSSSQKFKEGDGEAIRPNHVFAFGFS